MLGQKLSNQTQNALDNRKSEAILEFEKIVLPLLELASQNGMKSIQFSHCKNSSLLTEMHIETKHKGAFRKMTVNQLTQIFKLLNRGKEFFIEYGKTQNITIKFSEKTDESQYIPGHPGILPRWEYVVFNWSDLTPPPTKVPVASPIYPSLQDLQIPSAPPVDMLTDLHQAVLAPPGQVLTVEK